MVKKKTRKNKGKKPNSKNKDSSKKNLDKKSSKKINEKNMKMVKQESDLKKEMKKADSKKDKGKKKENKIQKASEKVSNKVASLGKIERVPTGIKGFDKLVQGGFPSGFVMLVTGTPGCGKTLFGMEYVYNGARKYGEKGMIISFEQSLDDIRHQAAAIGLDLVTYEKKGLITLMHIPITELDKGTLEKIKKEVERRKIKRLVVDSISTLSINAPIYTPVKDVALKDIMNYKAFFSPPILGDFVVNRFIYGFIDNLRRFSGCTTMVTAEAPEKGDYLSRDTISEFICDGVLALSFESMGGEYSRSLIVRKMRGTKNDEDVHALEISDKGLVVHDIE